MNLNLAHYDPWVYILLSVAFALVIAYWVFYTRRSLKTRRNLGTTEGIVEALRIKEHDNKIGPIGPIGR
jgi:hypothetical protein